MLHYSVVQRRHEIGIRMAIGAQASDIAGRVIAETSFMVPAGAIVGVALGMSSIRYVETLFYQVKATDLPMLALPSLAIVVGALLAAFPAVIQAVRIDPTEMLRQSRPSATHGRPSFRGFSGSPVSVCHAIYQGRK